MTPSPHCPPLADTAPPKPTCSVSGDYERRPGCPSWCMGHMAREQPRRDGNLTHTGMGGEVGDARVAVTYCSAVHSEPQVMVYGTALKAATVLLDPKDAIRWVIILEAAGSTELAGLIRNAVALIDGEEVARAALADVGRHAALPTTTETKR